MSDALPDSLLVRRRRAAGARGRGELARAEDDVPPESRPIQMRRRRTSLERVMFPSASLAFTILRSAAGALPLQHAAALRPTGFDLGRLGGGPGKKSLNPKIFRTALATHAHCRARLWDCRFAGVRVRRERLRL